MAMFNFKFLRVMLPTGWGLPAPSPSKDEIFWSLSLNAFWKINHCNIHRMVMWHFLNSSAAFLLTTRVPNSFLRWLNSNFCQSWPDEIVFKIFGLELLTACWVYVNFFSSTTPMQKSLWSQIFMPKQFLKSCKNPMC